jgi:pimeloyl-ACP methyl ester carboxylesterase
MAAVEGHLRRLRSGRFWVTTFLIAALIYAAVVALAFVFQTKMIFPGAGPDPLLPHDAQQLRIEAPDGAVLRGVLIPANHLATSAPLILSFPGNATNAASAALYVHDLYPQAEVIAFHYRGYPPSTGRIGAAAIGADALLEHDLAARRFLGRPIVAIGFSVGSGVASWVASRRPLAGLILVTPFDSLEKVAAERMPWLPVRWLFRNPMDSAEWLKHSRLPVAVIAGGSDELVRPARTDALRRAIPHLVYDRTIAGADHNDIYGKAMFQEAMREALAAVISAHQR